MGPYKRYRYQTILPATLNRASKRQRCPPVWAWLRIFGQWCLKETFLKYRGVSSFYSAIIVKFVIDNFILFYSLRNIIAALYFIFVVFLPLFPEKKKNFFLLTIISLLITIRRLGQGRYDFPWEFCGSLLFICLQLLHTFQSYNLQSNFTFLNAFFYILSLTNQIALLL